MVQVSPRGSEPVVCKILDFNKMIFSKKKNLSMSKTKDLTLIRMTMKLKQKKLKALLLMEIRLKYPSVLEAEKF